MYNRARPARSDTVPWRFSGTSDRRRLARAFGRHHNGAHECGWRRGLAMTSGTEIQDLIVRVRAGDQHAAAELVRDYEALVRHAVRIQLRDPRLRSVLDTAEV